MRNALCVKFPDHQGKYREFSRFRPSQGRLAAEKAVSSLGFLRKFPTQPNRELFWRNREFFPRIREFTGRIREISNSPHTRFAVAWLYHNFRRTTGHRARQLIARLAVAFVSQRSARTAPLA